MYSSMSTSMICLGATSPSGANTGLMKNFLGARYSRTDMTVIIRQALIKHDAVAQRHFLFEFLEFFFAAFHFSPLS